MQRSFKAKMVAGQWSRPTRPSPWIALCIASVACGVLARPACAQNWQLSQANVTPLPIPATPPAPITSPTDPYARFDPLRWKGLNIPLPGPVDTLDQRLFGVRDALADQGIGYLGLTNDTFQDNLIHHGHPAPGFGDRQNQLYNGQLPTYSSTNLLFVTYDLGRFGIPDGQIVVGGTFLRTNWNPLGPNSTSLSTATYYQTFFNRKVEFKIGYLTNSLEFLGTYVGGNIAGGIFGPSAGIPVEQGLNTTVYSTPGANLKINLPQSFYTKAGIQRALSPDGVVVEHNQNVSSVRFVVPNSGVLLIDEAGYRVDAAPGVPQTWVRAAGTYTSSKYQNYDDIGQRAAPSYGLFLLADRQLLQTAPRVGTAFQGIYAGFSVEYAPPQYNRFSQYYELRLYGFGLIPTRPRDQVSLVITDNVFSKYLVDTARSKRQLTHDSNQAVTLSYSAHVYPGVNLNAGISYNDNPTSVTYTGNTGSALNILLGTVTFF